MLLLCRNWLDGSDLGSDVVRHESSSLSRSTKKIEKSIKKI
jgi:hypothetical protein